MINFFLAICKFINNLAAFPAILVVRGKNKTDWGDDELKFAGQKKNRRRRGEIRHCRWQCKIFANGVNFPIFTHFLVFLSPKTVEIRRN